MSWLVVAPVALPAVVGSLQLMAERAAPGVQRPLALVTTLALLAIAIDHLAAAAAGDIAVYAVGDWRPPLGIVLVRDRLSAYLLVLTSLVALAALVQAMAGWDRRGRNFHGLFMFQLVGINGAFLTGDLFNLFVFFEVLLIASFCLMLHGGGPDRLRAGTIYVGMNLVGSALFLTTVGLLYGSTGTLNMAQLSGVIAGLDAERAALAEILAGLLLVVFALKAAIFPLHLWLPRGYGAAAPPIAALFAIMTKVGLYAFMRVGGVLFGAEAGALAWTMHDWLLPLALATLWVGMLGVVASRGLGELAGFLLVASIGTSLIALGVPEVGALGAGLYYLGHSVVAAAALFLLLEPIAAERGSAGDRLRAQAAPVRARLLGGLFLLAAIALLGLPPLSGFVGKALLLDATRAAPHATWIYATVLLTALVGLVGCSRAGVRVFWSGAASGTRRAPGLLLAPAASMLAANVALTAGAGPAIAFTLATAEQVLDPSDYIAAVMRAAHATP